VNIELQSPLEELGDESFSDRFYTLKLRSPDSELAKALPGVHFLHSDHTATPYKRHSYNSLSNTNQRTRIATYTVDEHSITGIHNASRV
jgi:hypothetical protein